MPAPTSLLPASLAPQALLTLTVDLDAIVANWRRVMAEVAPSSASAAGVVKADAYGLGMAQVAPALARAGCSTFFTATIDEGLALRAMLPQPEIFVLCGPLPGTTPLLAEHRLVPVLNSPEQIALWSAEARARGQVLDAALHVDTGMNRLGLQNADAAALVSQELGLDGIRLTLGMSHMACADDPETNLNQIQRLRFAAWMAGLPVRRLSLAASSGLFLGADFHFHMVRPGAALYGINPTPGSPNPMRPAIRLQGKILQIRDVDTPMTVGYGASHAVTGRGRIATVAVGYADGYQRVLGGRGHGIIGGIKVPVVGRVSMDIVTFDISSVPEDSIQLGGWADLICPQHDVDALAAEAGTIGYEILTQLPGRATRAYVGEQG